MVTIENAKECTVSGYTMKSASTTRAALAEIFAGSIGVDAEAPVKPGASAEEKKALAAKGKELFGKHQASITPLGEVQHWVKHHDDVGRYLEQVVKLTLVEVYPALAIQAALNVTFCVVLGSNSADESAYILAGAVGAAKAAMFKAGIDLTKDEKLAHAFFTASWAPRGTSSYQDALNRKLAQHTGFEYGWAGFMYQLRDHEFGENLDYMVQDKDTATIARYCPSTQYHGLVGVLNTEDNNALFHGFTGGYSNIIKLRWTSGRVASAVKEVTGSDDEARRAADRFRDVQSFKYSVFPNDYPFGDVYVEHRGNLGSCMTYDADDYNTPFGIHPCDTYSASWFGVEDNHMALVVAFKGEEAVGRGIMNTQDKNIVRWYGDHRAEVQLRNKFGIIEASNALSGLWLAHVSDGSRFGHPYLDGNADAGDIEDDRVVLCLSGDYDLADTGGCQWTSERHSCVIDGDYYPEDELRYQPKTETWYNPENTDHPDAVLCPLTDEWTSDWNSVNITLNGEEVMVTNYGYRHVLQRQYTRLDNNIGWVHQDNLSDYAMAEDTGEWDHVDNLGYDDVTEYWYTSEGYAKLTNEREEAENDEASTNEAA